LVHTLNAQGAQWNDPISAVDMSEVDACSTDRLDPTRTLPMQVVRASNDQRMWMNLQRNGSEGVDTDVDTLASELMSVVAQTANRYPPALKASLTLVLDTSRTVGHSFSQVPEAFRRLHMLQCQGAGFQAVWLVGHRDELAVRLDA
jgi:hypothetical protein